jgi:hypothetical protein
MGPHRLAVVSAVAVSLLASAVSGGATGSGLYGTVRKGPIRPVCQVGVPCDAPVRGTLVFSRGGDVVARVRPTLRGRYRVALTPGIYEVRATVKIGLSAQPRPRAVHVRAGHWDEIDLFFDTGIR